MRLAALSFLIPAILLSQTSPAAQPDWIAKSNRNAELLLTVIARYSPEGAGSLGIRGLDDKVSVPTAENRALQRRDTVEAVKALRERLAAEQDPLVKQDLEILIQAANDSIRADDAYEKRLLPYFNAGQTVFFGMKTLLDDQVEPERRKASLVRLRRYTGIEPGSQPLTELAEKFFLDEAKKPALLGPAKAEVEKDLDDMDSYSTGIGLLLEKYKMSGYGDAYAKLQQQLNQYKEFLRKEVLPRARTDFRLPPEIYQVNLEQVGVDYEPAELVRLAHQRFTEWQAEMQKLATRIAAQRKLSSSDYRSVIRELKKEQLPADKVMPLYHERLTQIEAIIRREHLLTLPGRPAIIRLASAAETAQQPAPHMVPPPLVNNHGERGQFVLPGGTTGPDGKPLKYDDFTFAAGTWTLTAHEARPGHELQFAAMVERGVSQARAIFAFNSTNVEGWGLYSEWVMLPYMPDEGKLISLQLRLLRAARAFLDPELQQGKITPQQALSLLENDVVLSKAFATEEVDRYTFRSPGQAVSYFDGYERLQQLRTDTERQMGKRFSPGRFHDFVLSQGLLPPNLMRAAVMKDFVVAQ